MEVVGEASVPPPELLTVTFWAAGFAPPAVAVKLRLVGESEMAGEDTGFTVNATV
jgi:hypothetical protein